MDKHRSASASISQPTKSSTPQNVTPFHSIFLSLTRPIPIPAPNSTTQTYIPYLVLFQHNRHLFQRLKAAEPENNNDNTTKQQKQIYKNAGLTYKTPQQTSRKDARGDLFVKEAWSECVERCDGRVILVSCCDLIPLLDTGTTSCTSTSTTRTRTDEHKHNHRGRRSGHKNLDLDREERLMQSFRDNGAIVDLHSDPLGWDSDSDSDEEQKHDEKDLATSTSTSTFKGQVTKLQSILSAIHRAAQHIRIQTRDSKCTETGVQMQMQIQPIPIIFDSATPILLHHGVNKLILLLTYLKQQSQHPKTKMGMDMDDNTMNGNTPAPASILSPIFLPTLAELLPPSSMRVLEDTSDAVMTLQGGELAIYKRSGRAGGMISSGLSGGLRLIKDVQLFDIEDDGSDEQGGGSGSGSGSVHITSATTNGAGAGAGGAVTLGVPTGRLVLRTKKGTTIGGGSSGSGNVKKMNMKNSNDGDVEDVAIATQNMTLNSSAVPGASASASASGAEGFASSSGKGGKERLVLMHENENTNAKSNANEIDAGRSGGATTEYESAKRPTPRIYLEEDDPEFDDLDEEDPDDDLDI